MTLRILLFFKRPIRRNRLQGRCCYARGHEESRKSRSTFSGGFWEEATSLKIISTHIRTTISCRGLMCLLEIITHIQAGRGLWDCILTCVAVIKAKGAGFVAESWSVTGFKCRDFTGELLRGEVFVLAVETQQG